VAICAICKSQFSKIMPAYGFEMDSIVALHQLVSNAIVLDGQVADDPEPLEGESDGAGDNNENVATA
jgi:hypothetical protein